MTDYVAWGGRAELERRVRAPMLPPATRALFGRIGVASPARFLHVLGLTAGLGPLEPDGRVVAPRHGSLLVVEGTVTRDGVEEAFRVTEVRTGGGERRRYDVVYTRLLLSRVPCPEEATAWMAGQLDAGGVLLIEDVQGARDAGLPDLLHAVGLHDVVVDVDPLARTVQGWGRVPKG